MSSTVVMDKHVEEVSLPVQNQTLLPDGSRFPAAFVPKKSAGNSLGELLELIRNNKELIKEQVVARGAVLFRGWQVNGGKEFAEVVDALGYDDLSYEHGEAPRKQVAGSVYTANETPVDQVIGFHNEMSYLPHYPDVIMFYCETPSPHGGGTALLHGKLAYDRLAKEMPDFVQRTEEHKITYYGPTAKDWRTLFKTSAKHIAQSRAKALQARLEWDADDNAIIYRGPFSPSMKHPVTGATVWFNGIGVIGNYVKNYGMYLGDGSLVPVEDIRACISVYGEEQAVIEWENGDLLIVDNLSVMHSRLPGQPPRVVLVALGNNG